MMLIRVSNLLRDLEMTLRVELHHCERLVLRLGLVLRSPFGAPFIAGAPLEASAPFGLALLRWLLLS